MSSFVDFNPRVGAVTLFYRTLLGREPDEPGLDYYVNYKGPLEVIYTMIYTSDEAVEKRKVQKKARAELNKTLPITLAMFVKNNEDSAAMAISSVKPIVREIVVLDTGSTDNTINICKELGALVYSCGFNDFGSIRTLTARLARQEWILGLDSDEVILEEDYPILKELVEDKDIDAWGLPRKRWADLGMEEQLEEEVYPDFQFRLFRNKPEIVYKRRIHEVISGASATKESLEGPHIHHFQDSFKSGGKLKERNELYKSLYNEDIKEGVEHNGSAVEAIDER
jgi:glycosyltransferase involved in cell wall biosynthesis